MLQLHLRVEHPLEVNTMSKSFHPAALTYSYAQAHDDDSSIFQTAMAYTVRSATVIKKHKLTVPP